MPFCPGILSCACTPIPTQPFHAIPAVCSFHPVPPSPSPSPSPSPPSPPSPPLAALATLALTLALSHSQPAQHFNRPCNHGPTRMTEPSASLPLAFALPRGCPCPAPLRLATP
eukprot:6733771-Prymnesium_polylepis.1